MKAGGLSLSESLAKHYQMVWGCKGKSVEFSTSKFCDFPRGFSVLEFEPHHGRSMWTYATCGMSSDEKNSIDLHIFSPRKSYEPVEILLAVAHYHLTGNFVGLGHTVNFGKPWLDDSQCEYGLVSLPYLDGPKLELVNLPSGNIGRCLWLIPITRTEMEFKRSHGLDALEKRFEQAKFNYLDPKRPSVC